jgi:hypothetical protein
MTYAPILEINIVHAYYEDGRCPSLALVAAPETATKLRKHRCQIRSGLGSVVISTELGPDGSPLLPLPVGTPLRFSIEATANDHVFVTDDSALIATSAPLFTNADLAVGVGGNLELVSGTGTTPLRVGVFADVEIIFAGTTAGQAPALLTFTVPLEARRAYWAFYCLTDLANADTELHIVDEALDGSVLLFRDEDRRKLDDAPDPTDAVGALLVQQCGTLSCVRFISSEPVVCLEVPRRTLTLRLGTEKLSSPLPNPSIRRPSRIELPTSNGSTQTCEVLTHLIEYRNHLTQTQN